MESIPELTKFIEEHEAALLRYANRLLKNRESAKDAVQEAFIRFVKASGKDGYKKKIVNAQAWLYRTTRNWCLDYLRSKEIKLEVALDERVVQLGSTLQAPDVAAAKNDEVIMLRKMINRLAPRDREVLILKIEQEKSYKEIAEIMDISTGNVGFILHNTIRKLREYTQDAIDAGGQNEV